MPLQSNSFEDLIHSFAKVCSCIENNTQFCLKEIAEECADEFNSGAKTWITFSQLLSGISETYSELLNTNEILKSVTNRAVEQNALTMPYELQSPIVKCIGELYSGQVIENGIRENKLIDDKSINLLNEIIKTSEKSLTEIRQAVVALQQFEGETPTD